jgi:hypothetical protein
MGQIAMTNKLPVTGIIPVSEMRGEDKADTALLHAMSEEAQLFLSSFAWCTSIREFYFGSGVGGIVAAFFAHIEPSRTDVDEYLWVIVGDLPPAYLVTGECPTAKDAVEGYIEETRKWIAAAKAGLTSPDIISVNVSATPEWAEKLEKRLDFLENNVLPEYFSS